MSCIYWDDCWRQAPAGVAFDCKTCWRENMEPMFREITSDDYIDLYHILLERDESINISHRKMPEYEEHVEFWNKKPYPWARAILVEGHFIGYCYLTVRNEIGLFLYKKYRSLGYGKKVLRMIVNQFHDRELLANINPANAASKHLFTGAGFSLIQETYRLDRL